MTKDKSESLQASSPVSPEKAALDLLWNKAKIFADSDLVPKHFQGKPANCFLAMEMASRLGTNELMAMQNIYVVHGRPALTAQFMISLANDRRAFRSPIRWREEGEGADYRVQAYARDRETGEECASVWVSMKMAKAEGWTTNKKYETMPEHMLRYRAATFLVRQFCPEVSMGFQTVEEMVDTAPLDAEYEDVSAPVVQQINEKIRAGKATPKPEEPPAPAEPDPPAQEAEPGKQATLVPDGAEDDDSIPF